MALQKKQIIQTALDILNRDGLEGVTLRRLATELNVKAASIYWHIASKEELLDEMANAILEAHFANLDFDNDKRRWDEWLRALVHQLRSAMLAHREGARVVAGAHPDVAVMLVRLWDLTVRILHNNGFSYGKAATITITFINFTFGSVIEEQASPPLSAPPEDRQINVIENFPAMMAALDAWKMEDSDAHFATGVRMLVNGVRAELRIDGLIIDSD